MSRPRQERGARGTTVRVDCEAGRRLGCASFCCRMIVRLDADEGDPRRPDLVGKRCLDKDPVDGLCVHFERSSGRCGIWERRPRICREYDCNGDTLLQVVLRDGFRSLTELVRARVPPASEWKRIPHLADDEAG